MEMSDQLLFLVALTPGKGHRYLLIMRPCGPQSWSGNCREKEISWPSRESNFDSSGVQSVTWALYQPSFVCFVNAALWLEDNLVRFPC